MTTMNINYAIFRSEPIYTLQDLAQIGSHNKREKKAYNSNPNIKIELSKNNIDIVPLSEKYIKGFYNLTKEYKKEHDERMKTEREDRKRTFNQMLNKSKNVIADELIFTASHTFFDNMSNADIKNWANTCMEFVYEDLGYKKEQILHAIVHLDEETPHLHCVVIPLIKKFDKRTNTERYTISKKQYIKDKNHLSELQDKYHTRLVNKGYDLERGIKGSDTKHQKVKEFKKTTRYYEQKVNNLNCRLDNAINNFENKMQTTKNIPFDKKHIILEKETFDSMNNIIKETKNIMNFQPKMEQLFNEVNTFTKSHKALEKENNNLQKEIKSLTTRNQNLKKENNNLKLYIESILNTIKKFFRHLLKIGNENTKEATTKEIKNYYDNDDFDTNDVYNISKGTTKEDELFDYSNIPYYYRNDKAHNKNKNDDFSLGL